MGKRGKLKAIVTIVLAIGLTSVLVGDSAGLMPGMDTDLGDSDASFWGEVAGDYSGLSVAGAGDVNGDGYDDILIGAWSNDEGGSDAGQTYLIFGNESGWYMDINLSTANASFWGEVAGDESGVSVAGAGDVNGDGYDDILIGANHNDDGGSWAGQTYLVLGKASGWSMDTNLSNADASFWGEDKYDSSGLSVAGAGDVNGDGCDDILIGAHMNDDRGSGAGKTYLIFGKADGWSMDTDLSNADASFWGESQSSRSGGSVAGAGDVNGDGFDDILIGAYSWGLSQGKAYLIFGKADGWTMNTDDLSNVNASFLGEHDIGYAGGSVAGAGDVNGDGYDDILIGAYADADGGGYFAGQTYLIFGKADEWSMDTDLSEADASFWGEDAHDYSGFSVAGAGDVNGDGYDDILIGARGNNDGGPNAGQTYLILGKASGWSMDNDLSDADASFLGEDAGDWSGLSVAGVGDVNGDGCDDILIGAHLNDDGGSGAGQTYLILGKLIDTDNDGVPDFKDAFLEDIAASLDTDGDGFPDEWNDGKTQADSTTGLLLDAFPDDVAASMDTDGDGYPDEWNMGMSRDDSTSDPKLVLDAFPNDPSEWFDSDGDGHGDNGDAFPEDPLEWNDADDDGHGDNGDAFPTDKDEWVDTDSDGSGDNGDAFPDDAAASVDSDGDGYPDEWNTGKSREDSTTGLKIDQLPKDPEEWKEKKDDPALGLVGEVGRAKRS